MKKIILTLAVLTLLAVSSSAQRTTDKLDRCLVAVSSNSGNFISWRIFGEEYYDTQYNLYRDGVKLNDQPLDVSNYTDKGGSATSKYQVAAVVRGVEQEKSAETTRWNAQYKQFAVQKLWSRRGTDITKDYNINDIALADVDGDGRSEFIVKRNYGPDGSSVANDSAYNCLECYNMEGDRLWYIDLGPNMVSGPDEQYDAVGYDWDGDGRAEILMRGADNMIIHHADGTTTEIGNIKVNTRNTVLQTANMTYTNSGAEYLLYLDGMTGKPYPIGTDGKLWMTYPLPRGSADDWGDGYGHRSTKHYFGAPFLDGRNAYIFLGRGCYTKHHMKAFSVDPDTHQLKLYWEWNSGNSGPYFGQGFHNFGIADVDWDGRDEIVFGSMVIDDNGKGLSTTGLGHGDAQHCSDFDPYRHGQEIFTCNEDHPAMNYRDATTSKIYYRLQSTSDDGRAMCGNFSNTYPGAIGHSSQSGVVSCVADKVISGAPSGFAMNWRIYWDGDLLEEALDGASSREGASRIFKADGSVLFTADGTANCNWTKNTPSAAGDILGDWREEIIVRTTDNKYIRIYTTNYSTKWRNYTLWHDHQYRQGMVWESMGYNQPPHASYYLGELEGITMAPPPLTMTGRTEVVNGGTIGTTSNHLIVCETNDTEVTVEDGAEPYILTFNVPSWVQGTNSTATNGNPNINRTYYTCEVKGGALAGATRLVKQGDGILNLPKVDQRYTGPTDIWAGTVNFDGSLLHSPLWLNRFAELNSDGGQFRSIRMDYDAKLRPGREDHIGTVTTDTLMLGFGSRVILDIDGITGEADQINTKYLSIETKNWQYGPKYLQPVFEFYSNIWGPLGPGRYLIGAVETVEGAVDNIRIEGLSSTMKSSLLLEDGKLYLVISGVRDAGDVIWTGAVSNVWDMAETENFMNLDGESDIFVTGDKVHFDDTPAKFNVNLTGDLEADSVFMGNSKSYTFSGTGALVGNTTLVKLFPGMLTIRNENTYTGGNRLSGGIVSVSSLANANQPKGNLGGVTTAASKFVIENGAELRTTAAVTNGSPIKFESEQGGIINNAQDFIVDKAMSGTVLTKKGNGWMKLNVANSNLTRLIIQAGTVQCVNANVPAKTVEFQGGTLNENTGTSYAVAVAEGKSGAWNLVNDATYTNKVTGTGTLTVSCPVRSGGSGSSKWYATRTHVALNLKDFEGTLKPVSNGDPTGRFTLDTSSGMPNGTMNIAADVEVQNSGKTFRIGRLAGTGMLGGSCTFSNGASVGANTWQVGNDENWTFNGKVTSNANFTKVGSGKVTWNGASDNTGSTTINEGELCLGTNGVLGTGMLTVAADGTLSCLTKTKKLTNASTTINGTLLVTATRCATSSSSGCTSFEFEKALAINGTIRIVPAKNNTLQVGDSIRIFTAGSFSGTPQFDMQDGIEWDASRIAEGLLFVKAIETGITPLATHHSPFDIYDTRGRLVRARATNTEGLPAGIYICEGRKFVVK